MPQYNCLHHNQRMSERILNNKIQPYCVECRKVELVADKMKAYMDNEESNLKKHKQLLRSYYRRDIVDRLGTTLPLLFYVLLPTFFFSPILSDMHMLSPVLLYVVKIIAILIPSCYFFKAVITYPKNQTRYSKPIKEDILKLAEYEQERNEEDVSRYVKKLHEEYLIRSTRIDEVDLMTGWEFEQFVANLLTNLDFTKVKVTKKTGDGGVDILAINPDGEKTAIQCKRVKSKVGFKVIQEIFLGKKIHRCKKGMIITNSYFTKPALEAGAKEKLDLWCRNRLLEEMRKVDSQFSWEEYLRSSYILPTGIPQRKETTQTQPSTTSVS